MKFILGDDKKIFEWGGMKLWWGESTGGNFILEGGGWARFLCTGRTLPPSPTTKNPGICKVMSEIVFTKMTKAL